MLRIFAILIAFAYLEKQSVLCKRNYCYSDDEHPYVYASSTTAYDRMHGTIQNTSVPNCQPTQIWMLARHGTRNPTKPQVKSMKNDLPDLRRKIVKNHEKHGRGSLCARDLEQLKSWEMDRNVETGIPKYLVHQGKREYQAMGARYKDHFPELLQYNADGFKFRSTDSQRTITSMNSFINGLFGDVKLNDVQVIPREKDSLLEIAKICKPWQDMVSDPSFNAEGTAFLNGKEIKRTVREVSERLGFKEELSYDEVNTMYTMCAFEMAWHVHRLSPWCAAFTEDQMKVFEYQRDLDYYYYTGYGKNVNPLIGCSPLHDMFEHFTRTGQGNATDEPRGIFYFAHNTMIQLFLTSIGAAKDPTPLKASNYEEMKDRKWRISKLVPFAANFLAVFYRCDQSPNKVRFYLNEYPLDLEGCVDGVCDWDYLTNKLQNSFTCNLDFCELN